MKTKTQILSGTSDDFEWVQNALKRGKECTWPCGKEIKTGDHFLIYFESPHGAIKVSAVALRDAKPGKSKWPYETEIGKITILSAPITIDEMREMFPGWKWLSYPRQKPYLDGNKARIAQSLWKRAGMKLATSPVLVKVSGAGFGKPEQNRMVERAACKAIRDRFERNDYKVVSREKENLGYDCDVFRPGEMLHVEVKGISGSLLKFPITANEIACARSDSMFRLAVVTEATTAQREVRIFTRKEFLKGFVLKPLAYFAEAKPNLSA